MGGGGGERRVTGGAMHKSKAAIHYQHMHANSLQHLEHTPFFLSFFSLFH